jgi:molybdopterin-synthase adenylyltransferase
MQSPNRYHRQILLPNIGEQGQSRLSEAKVLLIGCGALGTVIAEQLTRSGIGHLRIVDRDVVELTNLQRQTLFDESDAKDVSPKSIAAARRLSAINSTITIDPIVADVHPGNIEEFLQGTNLIFDGTDNAETRYLLNDAAVKHQINWIYGAAIATEGRVMAIRPNITPCLRCIFPDPPAPGELPTCDTAGVLGPAAAIVASLQTTLGLKLLLGIKTDSRLTTIDAWQGTQRSIDTGERRINCPCCGQQNFEFLNRSLEQSAIQLCGRNAVQIRPSQPASIKLPDLARKLAAIGQVQQTDFLIRCQMNQEKDLSMTIFPDGRTIVHGTHDITQARSLVSRYVGS